MAEKAIRDALIVLAYALSGGAAAFRATEPDGRHLGAMIAHVERVQALWPAGVGRLEELAVFLRTAQSMPDQAAHFLERGRHLVDELLATLS